VGGEAGHTDAMCGARAWPRAVVGFLVAASLVACGGPAGDAGDDAGSAAGDGTTTTADPTTTTAPDPAASELARLERSYAARLGVYAVDTGTGETVEYRADERFAYASTHKAFSAAAVLQATDTADLDEVIHYEAADLVGYSPVTEMHVETGLTLLEVIRAAITVSDNTAANLLFERLGGPDALEAALRAAGDDTTSVDRVEPELSDWAPGETRDTSTPRAMAGNLEAFALGSALDEEDRAVLVDALRDNTTGDELIRAGVPDGWVVGDKTGTSTHGGRNDIAVIEPPDGDPIVLAIYSNRLDPEAESDPALIAEATEVALDQLVQHNAPHGRD
jgi:beta-lactamase class A